MAAPGISRRRRTIEVFGSVGEPTLPAGRAAALCGRSHSPLAGEGRGEGSARSSQQVTSAARALFSVLRTAFRAESGRPCWHHAQPRKGLRSGGREVGTDPSPRPSPARGEGDRPLSVAPFLREPSMRRRQINQSRAASPRASGSYGAATPPDVPRPALPDDSGTRGPVVLLPDRPALNSTDGSGVPSPCPSPLRGEGTRTDRPSQTAKRVVRSKGGHGQKARKST